MARQKYVKRPSQAVAAVQLKLDTAGFDYEKWGSTQRCQPGDWLVDNGGDIYTVNEETFARTYRRVATGAYVKVTPVWAEKATEAGAIQTKEGTTNYAAGDYLVFNEAGGKDGYATAAAKFDEMYERVD